MPRAPRRAGAGPTSPHPPRRHLQQLGRHRRGRPAPISQYCAGASRRRPALHPTELCTVCSSSPPDTVQYPAGNGAVNMDRSPPLVMVLPLVLTACCGELIGPAWYPPPRPIHPPAIICGNMLSALLYQQTCVRLKNMLIRMKSDFRKI